MKYIEEYRNPEISKKIASEIKNISKKEIRLMEVCGTHTTSIFKNGIRSILPDKITLISGPGCPVCVTPVNEIDAFIELANIKNVIIATFGDLIRVPGSKSSLQKAAAIGKNIQVVSSPIDAVNLAAENRNKKVIFLGVGFETTAPAIAGSIIFAKDAGIKNYFVYSAHKTVPPALFALMDDKDANINGFILPGHVSMAIGVCAYLPFFKHYQIPSVIAGFEPVDILNAILMLVKQIETNSPELQNAYKRAVSYEGNKKAREMIAKVFCKTDAKWRGIGIIKNSGLKIRNRFVGFNAEKEFDIKITDKIKEPKGCSCGQILKGIMSPPECPLYKKICNPINPVGPCMVSSEGTCSAYFKYFD
jgi:hydrogenase expression/formation protein HypD